MSRRIAPFTLTIALLLATVSVHAQSHSSTELMREQTHTYFDSERKGGYRFMLTGALVALSGTALLLNEEEVANGASYPLLGFGVIELLAGLVVALRTPGQLDELDTQLSNDPEGFRNDELKRIEGVNSSFTILEIAELGIIGGGAITSAIGLAADNDLVLGIGAGAALGAASLLVLDLVAHSRAKTYETNLSRFRPGAGGQMLHAQTSSTALVPAQVREFSTVLFSGVF